MPLIGAAKMTSSLRALRSVPATEKLELATLPPVASLPTCNTPAWIVVAPV